MSAVKDVDFNGRCGMAMNFMARERGGLISRIV